MSRYLHEIGARSVFQWTLGASTCGAAGGLFESQAWMLRPPPGAGRTPGRVPGRSATPRPSPRCIPTRWCTARPRSASRTWAMTGVRRYLNEQLPAEENIECWFGQPIVSGERAAVEWWASWTEQGQELTYAGVTVLHFDGQGQVVEHRDYDNHIERRERPYSGW